MARMRIGDMLIKAGLIDEMQLSAALAQQKQWGGKLGDILVDHGFLDEMMLWLGLSKQLDVPLVSIAEHQIAHEVASIVPVDMCERLDIFPVACRERALTVATSNPNNVGALDEVAFRTGFKVKVVLAPQREVEWAIRAYLRGDRSPCPPPKKRPKLADSAQAAAQAAAHHAAQAAAQARSLQTPMSELIQPAMQPGNGAPVPRTSNGPAPARSELDAEEQLRVANEMLQALVELCVQRGVFTREELWARLTRPR